MTPGAFIGHRPAQSFRARVEDHQGDRWSVVGSLDFLSRHCAEQNLRIVGIAPARPRTHEQAQEVLGR